MPKKYISYCIPQFEYSVTNLQKKKKIIAALFISKAYFGNRLSVLCYMRLNGNVVTCRVELCSYLTE